MNFIFRHIWALTLVGIAVVAVAVTAITASADDAKKTDAAEKADAAAASSKYFKPEEVRSGGSVNAGGTSVSYDAIAGTLIVHPKDWDDAAAKGSKDDADKNPDAEASMFFVAYFKRGADPEHRPVTFLYNGGPGSSTVWLHMGAFGPKRVVTADDTHTPAAPYNLVNNDASLLDASDLVFIDAPGTGFRRIAGKDKEKAFCGVDEDANAFADFITEFLSKYGRWNSPKYLFGESYGTTRFAAADQHSGDRPRCRFQRRHPAFADFEFRSQPRRAGRAIPASICPTSLRCRPMRRRRGITTSCRASRPISNKLLARGASISRWATTRRPCRRVRRSIRKRSETSIAAKLHQYTGLPVSYILKANLRIDGGEFEKNLQDASDMTTGRLDTRFSGPHHRSAEPRRPITIRNPRRFARPMFRPSTITSAHDLHYGEGKTFKPEIDEACKDLGFPASRPPGAGAPQPSRAQRHARSFECDEIQSRPEDAC